MHDICRAAWKASLIVALAGCSRGPAVYESPEAAMNALIDAVERDDARRLQRVLGANAEALVKSGDPVADSAERGRFLDMYDEANALVRTDGAVYIKVGSDEWLFPIPIVKGTQGWMFDTSLGEREIVSRRIGRNEIATILVSLAYVDAQNEYAEYPRDHAGFREYAQRMMSTPGKQDGLYWPAADGATESPIGPLVAAAQLEGYELPSNGGAASAPSPYHGYYYRILKAQGASAADGAYDYVVDGHMIGGFALLAYPANYGNSGVKSFIVNQRGVVYEKDLGEHTAKVASAIERFDPDPTWTTVEDQLVASAEADR